MIDLLIILLSLILIAYGFINDKESYLVSGAMLYIFNEIIDLIQTYKAARLYRENKWVNDQDKSTIKSIGGWLRSFIMISGLYLLLNNTKSPLAGKIIWIGTIICYVLAGLIVSNVANIPLKMSYGGWYIDRKKTRKRR